MVLAAAAVLLVALMAVARRRATYEMTLHAEYNYPEPSESPGSQSGAYPPSDCGGGSAIEFDTGAAPSAAGAPDSGDDGKRPRGATTTLRSYSEVRRYDDTEVD